MLSDDVSAPDGRRAVILPANWRDLNPIRRLEIECFPQDAWPIWDILGVLTLPNVIRLKAVAEGELVGFIAGDVRPTERVAWIATIGVLPAYRRQGIGAALLGACEAQVRQPYVRLNVRQSNLAALQLYERSGYQRVGAWPAYYQDGEEALILEKRVHG
ncbi:MAG: GNAT family N-acetyltransferase, partial [Chloroflexi bacterium]|nr:GNAT family N-acetyltransferase [Chloroflexota bacterium]